MIRTVPREFVDAMKALREKFPPLNDVPDVILIEIVIVVAEIVIAPFLEEDNND
jgi:hypothetical protein